MLTLTLAMTTEEEREHSDDGETCYAPDCATYDSTGVAGSVFGNGTT